MFFKSNQIPTYRKPHLSLSSSICLVFLSLEMQGRLIRPKYVKRFFYYVWKEATHKSLNVAAVKSLFSSVYVIGKTCFKEYFLFYVMIGRFPFHNSLSLLRDCFNRHDEAFFAFFACFEESAYFMRYIHNNSWTSNTIVPK